MTFWRSCGSVLDDVLELRDERRHGDEHDRGDRERRPRRRSARAPDRARAPRRSNHPTSGSNVPTNTSATNSTTNTVHSWIASHTAADRNNDQDQRASGQLDANGARGSSATHPKFRAGPVGSSSAKSSKMRTGRDLTGRTRYRSNQIGRVARLGQERGRADPRRDLGCVRRARHQDDRWRIGQRVEVARELDRTAHEGHMRRRRSRRCHLRWSAGRHRGWSPRRATS